MYVFDQIIPLVAQLFLNLMGAELSMTITDSRDWHFLFLRLNVSEIFLVRACTALKDSQRPLDQTGFL